MKKVLFLSILFLVAFSSASFAQFKMALGPFLGVNYNFYSGTVIDNSNRSYNGAGLSVGAQADMQFTPVIGMLITLNAYDMMNASGSLVQQDVTTVQTFSIAYATLNPALKFSIPGTGLGFFAGPGIGFKMSGSSESYQMSQGVRTEISPKNDIMNMNMRINGQIGMSYDFDLKTMYITPYFLFDYGFNGIQQNVEWYASGIKFGVVFKFSVVK